MELEHSFTIPVSPERAWQVLLDVEQVAPCMPGATVDSVEGDEVTGRVKVKVGPVALTYAGKARFTERDEQAKSITLEASGKETRGAGTAAATVHSWLADEGGQTRVTVHTTMNVTGRPAQFGRGVMADVGGRIIEKFASNLAAQLAAGAQAPSGAAGGDGGGGAAASGDGSPAAAPSGNGSLAAPPGDSPGTAVTGNGALALPVEDLNLPVRAFNSLRREGIHTVGDLSARSEADLLTIPNLGPQSIKEIKQKLAERGLELASATAEPAPLAAPLAAADVTADTAAAAPPPAPAMPGMAPPSARPPDEDAIDLLAVAGFPVLKRALPAVGAVAVLAILLLGARRRRRRRRAAAA
jgi:carbon monoxide dehydrogenase subunit G